MSTNSEPQTPQPSSDAAGTATYYDPAAFLRDGRKHNRGVIEVCGVLGGGKGYAVKAHVFRVFEEASATRSLDPLRLFPVSGTSTSALESLLPGLKFTDIGDHASLAALIEELSA